jgi:N4-(beta-N-acetylglucosaminyl)-L-asparaginase
VIVRRPHPVVVASANGHPHCTGKAMEMILAGKPVVEAVVEGVTLVENDPEDNSVGYGGLPNEEGVVQLDSSVMDGPTCLAGAVACLENIKNPARVALHVLRYTDHCLLVGEGAKRFAKAHGFKEEDLLTEASRKIWLRWKANLSKDDDWFPTDQSRAEHESLRKVLGTHGTINCDAINAEGDLAGVTTTSGLSFKIPGRVGDSPIIGAGLYVDNDFGAAGSTGRGEANIISCGSVTVVEGLRRGLHPKDACIAAANNIIRLTRARHLVRADGKPDFNVKFYAVDKKGRHGGAAIYAGGHYAVFDAQGKRLEPLAFALER